MCDIIEILQIEHVGHKVLALSLPKKQIAYLFIASPGDFLQIELANLQVKNSLVYTSGELVCPLVIYGPFLVFLAPRLPQRGGAVPDPNLLCVVFFYILKAMVAFCPGGSLLLRRCRRRTGVHQLTI